MKAKEFIFEGRDAPLYHFTSLPGFQSIVASDTLKGRAMPDRTGTAARATPTISFTRDYKRDFVPGKMTAQSIGFRVDQGRLAQSYKMQPSVQRPLPDLANLEKNLSPANKAAVDKMRQTGNYSHGLSIGGVSLSDIAKKTAAQANRWESEERVTAAAIPDFSQYVTGIVVPGKAQDIGTFFSSMDDQTADMILDTATKLGVPVIWQRKEYDPAQVKQQIAGTTR